VRAQAADGGLNLVGVVVGEEFDQCQPCQARASQMLPGCGTIVVLGSGGSGFWQKMVAAGGDVGPPRPRHHPIERRTREIAAGVIALLAERGIPAHAVFPDDRNPINFVQLAECAGLGTVSPVIGLLLHPVYGPWVSLRAAILVRGTPFGARGQREVPASFQPCATCPRPCVQACPVSAYDGSGSFDAKACAHHRERGGSSDGCAVRRACPVGISHRYGADEESFRHAYSLFAMRRHYGIGLWKLVPRRLR
jgi:epoxyqueuosine reductase QueG